MFHLSRARGNAPESCTLTHFASKCMNVHTKGINKDCNKPQ